MNIVIAPSGFKEALGPEEVADCIEEGILGVVPDARIVKIPLVDGGEGFSNTLTRVTGGRTYESVVTGPVGKPVTATWGILGGSGPRTAVLEMAAAAGLRLVPEDLRNPLKTTTYGVGELIRSALDAGIERILLGCADSGTTDGGAGMAQALGIRLLDHHGRDIGWGGSALRDIAQIDLSSLDPRIHDVRIDAAVNFNTFLCGSDGTARLFAPQKGATPHQVEMLVVALEHFARMIKRDLGLDLRRSPGCGAAGGLGGGLRAFLGANLHHRYEIVMRYLEIDEPLRQADLVFTAEGCIDATTSRGKIPGEVARRAREFNIPTVALVGMIGAGAERALANGLDAYSCILDGPMAKMAAIDKTSELLKRGAENFMRTLMLGKKLAKADIKSLVYDADLPVPDLRSDQRFAEAPLLSQLALDMRTPLNLVIAHAKMIKDGLLGRTNPAQNKALTQTIKHAYWLLSMMHGLVRSIVENPVQTTATGADDVDGRLAMGDLKSAISMLESDT